MTQQGLHAAEVGSGVEHVGCESMAEFVRAEVRRQAGCGEVTFHAEPCGTAGQALPGFVDEERPGMHICTSPVFGNGFQGGFPNGNNALLGAFAKNPHTLINRIEVFDIQPDQLGESDSRGIKKFKDGRIPKSHPRRSLIGFRGCSRCGKEIINLTPGQKHGEALFDFWELERFYDVGFHVLTDQQKIVK